MRRRGRTCRRKDLSLSPLVHITKYVKLVRKLVPAEGQPQLLLVASNQSSLYRKKIKKPQMLSQSTTNVVLKKPNLGN